MYARSRYRGASSRISRRNKTKHFLRTFFAFVFLIFLLVGLVTLLGARRFSLKQIEVTGQAAISAEQVESLAATALAEKYFLIVPKSNFFIFDNENLEAILLKNFPRIETVRVDKKINGTLAIALKERRGDFLWCSAENVCFLMSRNGLIFAEASPAERQNQIIFKGNITDSPLMKYFDNEVQMQKFSAVIRMFGDASIGVNTVEFESADKIVFGTERGNIILNPLDELVEPVHNVLLLITDSVSKNPGVEFEYIDARFGKKMFYKLKSSN